jgi:hypothetical protein
LKTAVENFNIGISTNAEVSKIMKLAFLSLLVIVVILILMVYPQ